MAELVQNTEMELCKKSTVETKAPSGNKARCMNNNRYIIIFLENITCNFVIDNVLDLDEDDKKTIISSNKSNQDFKSYGAFRAWATKEINKNNSQR